MVKETRNEAAKVRNWIPLGKLISHILFESKMVQKLMDARMTKEDDFIIGKNFNGHTLKNMSLITHVVNLSELLDRTAVGSRRILVDDYPLFSKEEYKKVMEHYNKECMSKGCAHDMLSYVELLDHPVDVCSLKRKRKPISFDEGPFGPSKFPTKVSRTSGLSILRDTMRLEAECVCFETARSYEVTP